MLPLFPGAVPDAALLLSGVAGAAAGAAVQPVLDGVVDCVWASAGEPINTALAIRTRAEIGRLRIGNTFIRHDHAGHETLAV